MPMHGELKKIRCELCEEIAAWEEELGAEHACSACGKTGYLRPHIVWFGEMPLRMELIDHYLRECDIFLSIGTSGNVYPAAGFVQAARHAGARCVELNLERSLGASLFHEGMYGKATEIVPEFVRKLLEESGGRP